MKKNLFYTFNLFACVGIGACSGVNTNSMDKKKKGFNPKAEEIKKEARVRQLSTSQDDSHQKKVKAEPGTSTGTSGGSNVDEYNKKMRTAVVDRLMEMTQSKFDAKIPEQYVEFLVENDPTKLVSKNLNPFVFFSFRSPSSQELIAEIAKLAMNKQESLMCSFPTNDNVGVEVNIPWCIATHSEAHNCKDGDEDESIVYYYIDLKPSTHKDRPLKLYKVNRNKTVESIRIDNMGDFIEYCHRESKGIKKSIEDMERRRIQ